MYSQVTIYNPVGWNVVEPIRIPVKKGTFEVYAPNGKVHCKYYRCGFWELIIFNSLFW